MRTMAGCRWIERFAFPRERWLQMSWMFRIAVPTNRCCAPRNRCCAPRNRCYAQSKSFNIPRQNIPGKFWKCLKLIACALHSPSPLYCRGRISQAAKQSRRIILSVQLARENSPEMFCLGIIACAIQMSGLFCLIWFDLNLIWFDSFIDCPSRSSS
jgi:hypothetical protein